MTLARRYRSRHSSLVDIPAPLPKSGPRFILTDLLAREVSKSSILPIQEVCSVILAGRLLQGMMECTRQCLNISQTPTARKRKEILPFTIPRL